MMTSRMLSMPGVRGGVDFEHVHVAPFGDLRAGVAGAAGSAVGPVDAAQRAARIRAVVVLPTPRGPANTERLREPAAGERVAERPRHRLLPDDIVELLRPPLPRDDLV